MKHLTLKQRRRYRELLEEFEKLKQDPYTIPPIDYEAGKNSEEDEKYQRAGEAMGAVLQEIHELEEAGKRGN